MRVRSATGFADYLVVLLMSFAILGCTAASPPGASTVEPVWTPDPTVATPSVVALPDDLRAQLSGIAWVDHADGGRTVQRLGSAAIQFPASAESSTHVDHLVTGPLVTLVEPKDDSWEILDVNLATGGRRLITSIESDGSLAVDRHPAGDYLLVGNIGVDLVDVATGDRRPLIEPLMPRELEGGTTRNFYWSPTGRNGATSICSSDTCVVDLIDTQDWSVRRLPGTQILLALTDDYAVTYPSLSDRNARLLDLHTLESRIVAPPLAAVVSGYVRDNGRFVLYGVTSWPYADPIHRLLVLVDPASKAEQVLLDQGPDDWAYPFMDWTSNDWILLIPELAAEGRRPGVRVAVDTRTGTKVEFKLDDLGSAVKP